MKEEYKGAESENPAVYLRSQAEKIARIEEAQTLDALSPEEARQTLHELRVHQIELEIQNEELRRAQVELDAARSCYFDLYDLAPVGYCTISEPGLILEANLTAVTMLGVARADLVNQPLFRFIFKEDHNIYYLHRKQLFETGAPQVCELRMLKSNGAQFWSRLEATVAQDDDGAPTFRIVLSDIAERKRAEEALQQAHDRLESCVAEQTAELRQANDGLRTYIAENKRAEESLRESENKFRSFAEYSMVGIYLIQDGVLKYVNPVFAEMFGYTVEECLGNMLFRDFVYPEDYGTVKEQVRRRLSGEVQSVNYTFRGIKKTGEIIHVEIFGSLIMLGGKTTVTGTMLDITGSRQAEAEKRSLEERLHNAEKMEVLGKLAGRIAHDLNNVLGVLSGYSEILTLMVPEGSPLKEFAINIFQSSVKAAAIVEDLLMLTRRGVRIMEVAKFNKIIADLLATPEFDKLAAYHPSVIVRTDLAKDLLNISGSPVHIEKTIFNLVSNAVEAIAGGGEVKIKTENRYIDKAIEGYQTVAEGEYVVLTVSDTGKGIPASELKKIYEPFYTRKSMGRSGTGLGLAIVQGTVQDHDGYIDVQSTEEKGTTFTLYFPATRKKAEEETQKTPMDQYMGHGESVLVVDDVKEQREVATTLLTQLGYSVNAVSSGEDAVEYLKSNKADILVLDMIMEPGIDGLDTYKQVLEINPHQKAVIVSGFSQTDRSSEAQKLGAGPYIKKPYMMETIGVAIRNELGRK